ncbi:hypothetical protein [Demequina iriomotensis]|uniref:hypothetical protein n=1 Tax=Demequina iriomotensis TaxID=1536641 RepID=UPI0007865EB0|nr:hypothetical protein [Demequina iriomotensis]
MTAPAAIAILGDALGRLVGVRPSARRRVALGLAAAAALAAAIGVGTAASALPVADDSPPVRIDLVAVHDDLSPMSAAAAALVAAGLDDDLSPMASAVAESHTD